MLKRHSSRRNRLDQVVLNKRLENAVSYDRIAGYFRSSLFEVAGEALKNVNGPIRIICNSDIDPQDLATAAAAQAAIRRSWCDGKPEDVPQAALPRYQALYEALTSRRIEVRVLPDTAFGLIHGKAGVIRYSNGTATSFLGSVNESSSAWKMNYELLWEDDSEETIKWVQEEFEALWNDARAMDLSCCPFVVQDVKRIISRRVIEPDEFKTLADADPTNAAAAAIETPVYRREQGLWPHQKYFARLALERHRLGGARLVLADQVGLGKTVQLAMAALLMALDDPDGGPILVLAPKPILQQWQDEMMELLHLPSARWNGRSWIDENDLEYPSEGAKSLSKCPRRIGLVSQGLVVRGLPETKQQLLNQRYTCVIVDESHRARRRKVPKVDASNDEIDEKVESNKLMTFLKEIGPRTKSMLLATATPVQLHPVEAWDLLDILSRGNDGVLGGGTLTSPWYRASHCLDITNGVQNIPVEARAGWEYVRDPLPSRFEAPVFESIRRNVDAEDKKWQFSPEVYDKLPPAIQKVQLQNNVLPIFADHYNPLLRCIVRRTRAYLEKMIDPATGNYYLPRVAVRLFGEGENDSITLGGYLREAYVEAEEFCRLLQKRVKGAGFFKTLLLRRLGSSMEAGRKTVINLLGHEIDDLNDEDDDDTDDQDDTQQNHGSHGTSDFKNFTAAEVTSLNRCLELLKQGGTNDPKLEALIGYLLGTKSDAERRWLDLGCILFSQYYDTVKWVGDQLAIRPEFSGVDIGLYAGSNRSGIWSNGKFLKYDRETIKGRVRSGELKLLLGTDAASEGLNLQRLGTLINIDLPWNPTRLEQRKGRIQRIGQARPEVWIANLRYRDSVEDRVHQVLAERLESFHQLFGQIPDTLEEVWVTIALEDEVEAKKLIDRTTATRNPFDIKYSKVEDVDWESCSLVLEPIAVKELLSKGW